MGRLSLSWFILIVFTVIYQVLYMRSDESHHIIISNIYLAAAFIVAAIKKTNKDK